ncbi:MAG: hypothetical protein KDJ30_15675, partial [Rhodoblastus sp.]|nr:hypothetical protein [Rhodoblastus sp.]
MLRSGVSAVAGSAALLLAGADVAAAQSFWDLFSPRRPVQRVEPMRAEPAAKPRRARNLSVPARYKNPDLKTS